MPNHKQMEFAHTLSISCASCNECEPRFSQLSAPISIVCQITGAPVLLFSLQILVLYFHFLK